MALGKLTAKQVEELIEAGRHQPGRHTDGAGLHLHVRDDGSATWVLRFRQHGRQRDMGLGPCDPSGRNGLRLSAAREAAAHARDLIRRGDDPILVRRKQAAAAAQAAHPERTFEAAAKAMIETRRAEWRNAKHAMQWEATLAARAYSAFGSWPVADVDQEAVLRALRPIWTKTPETASRLRGRIEAVLDYARARGWRTGENPARWKGNLAELLPGPRKVAPVENHPALPWRQVPAFMAALALRRGGAALALRFAILTAARTGEVRGATWREIDLDARIWTISGRRMKGGKVHRVPLSAAAMVLLGEVRPLTAGPGSLIFLGAKVARPLSDMSLSMLTRGMCLDGLAEGAAPRWRDGEGRPVVPHGFRSSFKEWSLANAWPDHLSERALAHVDKDRVRAAYARGDLIEERRPMMDAWASWCCSGPTPNRDERLPASIDRVAPGFAET